MSEASIPVIGVEYGLARVMNLVRKVAVLDSPVLLLGETGTGKDLMPKRFISYPAAEKIILWL